MPDYSYDVFISYSSADRSWALKLSAALREKGMKPFLDQERLDIGKPWEPALAKAVQTSQHFIVLWSNHAEKSRWVGRELGVFEAIVDPAVSGPTQEDRRFIFLMLEGENPAYTSMQMLSDLREANAYEGGADAVDPSPWQKVVKKLVDAMRANDPSTPLPVAVLSMTRQELTQLDPNEERTFGPSLNTLLQNLGMGTIETLARYYGEERTDWRPFGNPLNVRQILDTLLDKVNNGVTPPFRWEPLDPQFWTNMAVARGEREKLLSHLSVVVIDPLSLYDERVYDRFVFLSRCFESEKSIIMALTPFGMPQPFSRLNTMIRDRCTPFFDTYYDPPIPYNKASALLGVNISDESDVRRLLRLSLGQHLRGKSTVPTSSYLRQ
ncbi:MAG: toll/interleukin-1 receptor domain-containing protein [Deltaproteobacteria bacterium]|nr:toll/interleukin-1 receptor domain-containing protein [Deltaproteobacteria bacterium]